VYGVSAQHIPIIKFKRQVKTPDFTGIEEIAQEIRPIITGIIHYYQKFSQGHMRYIWNQLNARLLKWVKWEKGLYKYASIRWLKQKYKEKPDLFPHWQFVNP
jgi:RNA-directed DNA polymerase